MIFFIFTKKGKKLVVKGKKVGTVTIPACDKKNKELGSWAIRDK